MSTALAQVKPTNVYEIVERQESTFKRVLSSNDVVWEQEKAFAIQILQANDPLNRTAWNNQQSLINAVSNVASIGISLNPAKKHAYLVPRDGKVCLDVSFMGLIHVAMSSGSILWAQSKIVYEKDTYTNVGIDRAPIHEQNTFGEKGKVIGVYCTVKTPQGDYLTDEMDMDTLNKIMGASKAKNGPWKTWFEEMARKSVAKRGYKYWPQNERMSDAVHFLNEEEGNSEPLEKDVTPQATFIDSEQVKQLQSAIKVAGGTDEAFLKKANVNNFGDIALERFEPAMNFLKSLAQGNKI